MDIASLITPSTLFFYLLAGVVVVSSLGVALAPNILYSAFALLGALAGVSGLYMLLGADFVGIVQLLVYVGGILVLILFAVLLTNKIGAVKLSNLSAGVMLGAPAAIGMMALLARVFLGTAWHETEAAVAPTTQRLGDSFLREHLLPFEFVSLVLLMALVGAMVIARRAAKEESKGTPEGTHDRLA